MKDVFAMTLKAKMPGLDDPGMHGSHRHFVNFIAVHAIEVGGTNQWMLARCSLPGLSPRSIG